MAWESLAMMLKAPRVVEECPFSGDRFTADLDLKRRPRLSGLKDPVVATTISNVEGSSMRVAGL